MWSEEEIQKMERRDRVAAVRHNRRMRRKELQEKNKKNSSSLLWVWEFAKKLVLICSMIYVFCTIYACIAMWRFFDFTYLGTLIEQTSDILKTCVFGYLIKAGFENVFKISGSNRAESLTEQERETACVPPDGDD